MALSGAPLHPKRVMPVRVHLGSQCMFRMSRCLRPDRAASISRTSASSTTLNLRSHHHRHSLVMEVALMPQPCARYTARVWTEGRTLMLAAARSRFLTEKHARMTQSLLLILMRRRLVLGQLRSIFSATRKVYTPEWMKRSRTRRI